MLGMLHVSIRTGWCILNVNSYLGICHFTWYPIIHHESCHGMSCDVVSCHGMSCHVMSCHVMSCHVQSGDVGLLEAAWLWSAHLLFMLLDMKHECKPNLKGFDLHRERIANMALPVVDLVSRAVEALDMTVCDIAGPNLELFMFDLLIRLYLEIS